MLTTYWIRFWYYNEGQPHPQARKLHGGNGWIVDLTPEQVLELSETWDLKILGAGKTEGLFGKPGPDRDIPVIYLDVKGCRFATR